MLINYKIDFNHKYYKLVVVFIITISFASVCIKLEHIKSIEKISNIEIDYYSMHVSYYDYLTSSMYQEIDNTKVHPGKVINFDIDDSAFGKIKPIEIKIDESGWYKTNIGAFFWNKLYVYNKNLDKSNLKQFEKKFVLYLQEGKSVLSAKIEPPLFFVIFHYISLVVMFALILMIAIVKIKKYFFDKSSLNG